MQAARQGAGRRRRKADGSGGPRCTEIGARRLGRCSAGRKDRQPSLAHSPGSPPPSFPAGVWRPRSVHSAPPVADRHRSALSAAWSSWYRTWASSGTAAAAAAAAHPQLLPTNCPTAAGRQATPCCWGANQIAAAAAAVGRQATRCCWGANPAAAAAACWPGAAAPLAPLPWRRHRGRDCVCAARQRRRHQRCFCGSFPAA